MSPTEMLLGCRPKSRLDLLKPLTANNMMASQMNIVLRIRLGQEFSSGSKWLPGVISKRTGPVLFVVQMSDGCERRYHQDQLQGRTDVTVDEPFETDITPSSADTSDLHSPSDTEPTSGVSSRPEQVTAAPE